MSALTRLSPRPAARAPLSHSQSELPQRPQRWSTCPRLILRFVTNYIMPPFQIQLPARLCSLQDRGRRRGGGEVTAGRVESERKRKAKKTQCQFVRQEVLGPRPQVWRYFKKCSFSLQFWRINDMQRFLGHEKLFENSFQCKDFQKTLLFCNCVYRKTDFLL